MKVWCSAWVWAAWWCVVTASVEVDSGGCDITIGDHTYREDVLVSDVRFPRGLAVNYKTDTLYFHYNSGLQHNAMVNLKSKAVTEIEELTNGCWFAVDQVREYVHVGCDTDHDDTGGLYQWDSNTGHFELAGEAGQSISFAYHHNNTLYYSIFPEIVLQAFSLGHSHLTNLTSPVLGLVFDVHGDFVYHYGNGVYRRRGDGSDETRYDVFNKWVWALAADNQGAAYTCSINEGQYGIWRLDDRATSATKLLHVPCIALTFDADDNIIYGDNTRNSIVRLVKC